MKEKRAWLLSIFGLFFSGCTVLYSVQLGEINGTAKQSGAEYFEIIVSEVGVNLDEAASVAKSIASTAGKKEIEEAKNIMGMFQMGPRTGNPVYSDDYADAIFGRLKERCPSGKISNLVSIREAARYPVVSGEIVKITGYCYP